MPNPQNKSKFKETAPGEIVDYAPKPKVPEMSRQELEQAREVIQKEIAEKPSNESEPGQGQAPAQRLQKQAYPTSDLRHPISEKSPALLAIESILEEDLREAFVQMDPASQMRFKQEGERTAKKIEQLMSQVKVKVKQILDLIRNWLKTIPHVNKFFIEQETKIKVDKIMALRKSE